MGYISNVMQGVTNLGGGKLPKPKKVKMEEYDLYENRLQIAPETNVDRMSTLAPWWNSVNAAAEGAVSRVGAGASPLFAQLEADASGELARGGELDPWQQREATQGARAAWQSRGMVGSSPAGFAEVLARVNMANARRQQRQAYATGVAGLSLQNRQQNVGELGALTSASIAPLGMSEGIRQFELERDDTLKFNRTNMAKDLKIGEQNAQAAKSAAKKSMIGSIFSAL